jgi:hypothetical protein
MSSNPGTRGALAAMCSLNEPDRAARAEAIDAFLVAAVEVSLIPRGVLLQLARTGANARALLDFIAVEKECCARYEYRVCSGKNTLDLEITGDGPDVDYLQTFYLGFARRPE